MLIFVLFNVFIEGVKEVLSYLMEHGVLALSAKTKLRLLPALNIKMSDLEKAVDTIIAAVKE